MCNRIQAPLMSTLRNLILYASFLPLPRRFEGVEACPLTGPFTRFTIQTPLSRGPHPCIARLKPCSLIQILAKRRASKINNELEKCCGRCLQSSYPGRKVLFLGSTHDGYERDRSLGISIDLCRESLNHLDLAVYSCRQQRCSKHDYVFVHAPYVERISPWIRGSTLGHSSYS